MKILKLIKNFPLLIGAYTIFFDGRRHLTDAYNNFLREPLDLSSKYDQSYCLITGGCSGIGLEYATQMASKGFSIIIIDKNEEKLSKLKINLEQMYKIQVHSIFFDFSKTDLFNYELLTKQLDSYKISFFINNVGVFYGKETSKLSYDEIFNMLSVNILPTILLTNYACQKNRNLGIINIGSEAGEYPHPHISMYAATKAFSNNFTKSLFREISNNINLICSLPGTTRTPMLSKLNGIDFEETFEGKYFYSEVEDVVKESLKRFGYQRDCFGTFKHWNYHFLLSHFGNLFWYLREGKWINMSK